VQEFKRKNGIYGNASGQLISDEQLSNLANRVAGAHDETQMRQAKVDQIERVIQAGNPDAIVGDALGNDLINKLREQYAGDAQREADISRRFGPDHEAAKQLRADMENIRKAVMQELGRIAEVYRNDLQ